MLPLRVHVVNPSCKTSTVHELPPGLYTLGRSSGCELRVENPRLSQRHVQLRVDDSGLSARDLGSSNGTFLDGVRVGSDEVYVPASSTLVMADVILRREEGVGRDSAMRWLRHTRLAEGTAPRAVTPDARDRIVSMVAGLFELLVTPGDVEQVAGAVCEFAAHALCADRAVVLMRGEEGLELDQVAGWPFAPDAGDEIRLSRGVIQRVLEQRDAVVVPTPALDPELKRHESCMNLSTALAVPLFDNRRTVGILYLDSCDAARHYSKGDLEVATIVANAAAVRLSAVHMAHQLSDGTAVVRAMLPSTMPVLPGYELLAHQLMSLAVGGDMYQFLPRPNGSTLIVLGDVAGKGLPAALCMTASAVALRALADVGGSLRAVTRLLDKHLAKSFADNEYITLFLGELDPTSGSLRYVNAGHPAPRIVHAQGGITRLTATRTIVGSLLTSQGPIPTTSRVAQLDRGDLLVVYSDGLTEATGDGADEFGEERLDALLTEYRIAPLAELCDRIVTAVETFVHPEVIPDDLTLVLVRRS